MLILLGFIWMLALLYAGLMVVYARGWYLQKDFIIPAAFTPETRISIIIPARNEERNIGACIRSILDNDYPFRLIEIVVINDHSTDNTSTVVQSFNKDNVTCLNLSDFIGEGTLIAYKKKAIEIGIANSSGALIITTDADCIVPNSWLKNIAAVYETMHPAMIVAPVAFITKNRIIEVFQSLDFMTMQGITASAHSLKLGNMSNGANLAFSRQVFAQVDGYKGVDHLASGDDYLLMMKVQKQFPDGIHYLKSTEAIVRTAPQPDWRSFLQQRIRWASKSGKYDDKKLTAILSLVYLFNLSFFFFLIAGLWHPLFWLLGAGILFIKIAVEIYFLLPVASFFSKRKELLWFPFLQPLHILYIVCAGFLGLLGNYKWKGRRVR